MLPMYVARNQTLLYRAPLLLRKSMPILVSWLPVTALVRVAGLAGFVPKSITFRAQSSLSSAIPKIAFPSLLPRSDNMVSDLVPVRVQIWVSGSVPGLASGLVTVSVSD